MTYINKPMSLIERKKQQWAREREELAGLSGPWGPVKDIHYEDPFGRKRNMSKVSTAPSNNSNTKKEGNTTPRRSSLPPLYKNQYNSNDRYEREKDLGGETSGYGSDNPNVIEYHQPTNNWHQSGYESSSSFRDDRLKWGDKGVGKFWGSRENLNYPKVVTNEPPGWVKRGLECDTEIVVANSSPAESPQQDYGDPDRPCTSSSNFQNRSHVRGQNVPLDHLEIMERERRRQIALAHQEAIRKQLEEREQRRREEKERRIQEEREEELRIEREQEIERKRREHEQKLAEEKQERDRKRKESIQEALEIAEREAKLAKMRQKMLKQSNNNNINFTECIVEKNKVPEKLEECNKKTTSKKDELNIEINNNKLQQGGNKISNLDQQNNNIAANKQEKCDNDNNQKVNSCQIIISPRENSKPNNTSDDNNNIDKKVLTPRENSSQQVLSPPQSARTDNIALLLQPNFDSFHSMQYAVLVPTINPTTHTAIPIAVPICLTTDRTIASARTENRVLTPTQFRNEKKILRDSSTQTDFVDFGRSDTADFSRDRYMRDKMSNSEQSYEHRSRKERRSRNEYRVRDCIEERPKWGANRPPTRYLKQSEKDPLYQRRKLRQKMRENKIYDDKNSSDESQTASPRSYRSKGYVEKRHTRALWRKHDHIFARNIRMYQTEIIPLETEHGQIYYRQRCEHDCCCHCRCSKKKYADNVKVDILKIEHTSPRETVQYKSEAIQRTDTLPLPDFDQIASKENDEEMLEKFCCLQDKFSSKRNSWGHSPRSPNLSATTRYNDTI